MAVIWVVVVGLVVVVKGAVVGMMGMLCLGGKESVIGVRIVDVVLLIFF